MLHLVIGGILLVTGSQKVLGWVPADALAKYGLGERVQLIGAGAVFTAILLLVPRGWSLGVLLASSFWGGTICCHMAHGESCLIQAMLLVMTWAGAYLRSSALLGTAVVGPSRDAPAGTASVPGLP
jgi:hypothetical protein